MALMSTMLAGRPEPMNDMEEEEPVQHEQAEAPEEEGMEEGEVSVPREVVAEVVKALSNPKLKQSIIEAAQSGDPSSALSGIAYGLLEGLDEKAKGAIPQEQMPAIAMEIVDMLSELANGGDDLKAQVMSGLLDMATQGAKQKMTQGQEPAEEQMPPERTPVANQMPMPEGAQ